MHWHSYLWVGAGIERADEAGRRPGSPGFGSSAMPPMRTGDWLVKPASRIVATFYDVERAAQWMAREFGMVRAALAHPEGVPLEERVEAVVDLLPRGVDVQWGEWLHGGRFISVGVICCPNRHVVQPCPMGSSSEGAA